MGMGKIFLAKQKTRKLYAAGDWTLRSGKVLLGHSHLQKQWPACHNWHSHGHTHVVEREIHTLYEKLFDLGKFVKVMGPNNRNGPSHLQIMSIVVA
jgi:hypothetical protein